MAGFERIDDLQTGGLQIIQDTRAFCFGLDAVLLSDFAKHAPSSITLDLCSGNGIVPLLLAAKTKTPRIVGLEIQNKAVQLARRSVDLNGLQSRIEIMCGDVKDAHRIFGPASFDAVTCNPPYISSGDGLINLAEAKAIARHEILCTLEDVITVTAEILRPRGRFFVVYRPERLVDLLTLMRQYRLEPKRLRFVHPFVNKSANLVLVEGVRGGGRELRMLPPLYVYEQDGSYTDEIYEIYGWEGR